MWEIQIDGNYSSRWICAICVRLCGVRLFNNDVMRQAGCSGAIVFLNWRQCQRSKPKEHEIVWILKLKLSELKNVFHILAIKNIFCYIDLCGFVHYECVSHCVTHLHNHVSCALVTAVKAKLWDEWFALVSHRNKSASLSQRKGKRGNKDGVAPLFICCETSSHRNKCVSSSPLLSFSHLHAELSKDWVWNAVKEARKWRRPRSLIWLKRWGFVNVEGKVKTHEVCYHCRYT